MSGALSNLQQTVQDVAGRLTNQAVGEAKGAENEIPHEHHVFRVGRWLPQDHRVHKDWLNGIVSHVDDNPKELHPVIQEFKSLIVSKTRLFMLFASMFEQIPSKSPYSRDPTGHCQIRDYEHMLQLLNHLITTPPGWNDKSHRVGLVGLPINAVLDWPMGTPSGFAVFLDPEVNAMLRKVLNAWGDFLKSPESAACLSTDENGWFGSTGVSDLAAVGNVGEAQHSFEELYVCDPSKPHHGFESWDAFFTRQFRPGIRPVAGPDDQDVIVNACESAPYNVAHGVRARDRFWVKCQPYSVQDMLAHDDLAAHFAGGTVYQAFLSALSYHRWHSPVAGTIVKAFLKPGTYYSEPLFEGLGEPGNTGIDMSGEATAQGYITAVATRAIIFIQADNPKIGLMAFIGVGMAEVSTCDITVVEGQRVEKGEQLGMFHFGGSTHCLLFREGVKVEGFPKPGRKENVPINSKLAIVS